MVSAPKRGAQPDGPRPAHLRDAATVDSVPARPPGGRRARELGQNFLIDRNILAVIERLASLDEDDVVLEIGGGSGVLSDRLAPPVRHLHVVEVDRGLEEALRGALARFDNVSLHLADALELDLGALVPAPNKVVANLPYGIAATAILRTIDELPSVSSWVVMVQREVGERLAAPPGSSTYGVTSVLAQIATDVKVLRPISRNVFRPVPNVDSVLVGLRRRGRGADPELRALVHDAFAHRRKALARSLALSGRWDPEVRERARAALVELGHPADERAQRLAPEEFRVAGGVAGAVRLTALAPAKVNLCLFLGPVRPDGRHELVTLFESVSLADELIVDTNADRDEVICPQVPEPNLVSRAIAGLRDLGWGGPPVRIEIVKRIPVAAGLGGGSSDAAAALRLVCELAPGRPEEVAALAASLGADVPSQLAPGLVLGTGAGDVVEAFPPLPEHAFVIVPLPVPLSTADVYREADRPRAPTPGRRALAAARRAPHVGRRPAPELLPLTRDT